jgi:hypothetical protein
MNRLADFLCDPQEPERVDDFFEIETQNGWFAVSYATALDVERSLDQRPAPRWIEFRDLSGSRHRLLARLVSRISENTAAQRTADRQFQRARRLEEKQDRRPWEDGDC